MLGGCVIKWISKKHTEENISLKGALDQNNIIEAVRSALSDIERKYFESNGALSGLLDGISASEDRLIENKVRHVINIIDSIEFNSVDEIRNFINQVALSSYKFKTPKSIIKLTLGINDFKSKIEFAEYCSGISQIAIDVFDKLNANGADKGTFYYAEEINTNACIVAKLLMVINEIDNFEIINKDTLSTTDNNYKFDLIFSDIPQSMIWNSESAYNDPRFKYGVPNKSNADWAFYQNILYHLKDTGLGIAVGTKGTLVRSIDRDIRRNVIEDDLIEAIITLPANLYEETGIGTELIIFNKNKCVSRKNKILFINASAYYIRLTRNQLTITDEGLEKIISTYKEGIEESHFSQFVTLEKIREYNYTLNSMEYLDFDVLKNTFDNSVILGDVAQITRGVQISKDDLKVLSKASTHYLLNIKDLEDGKINYDETSKITSKRFDWIGKYDIKPNDIIITAKGSSIKFAIVDDDYKQSFISGNLAIIRVNREKYNPYVLYEFLQSEVGSKMLEGIQTGTTVKILNPSKLEKLEIPELDVNLMNEIGEKIKDNKIQYERTIENAKVRFEENRENFKNILKF
nr:N-6 DNA methylase [Clostridium sp. YIM B02500]